MSDFVKRIRENMAYRQAGQTQTTRRRQAIKALASLVVLMCILLPKIVDRHIVAAVTLVCVATGAILAVPEIRNSWQRQRPRHHAQGGAVFCGALTVVFLVMAFVIVYDPETNAKAQADGALPVLIWFMASLAFIALVVTVWSFIRWRRLCAEARWRLEEIREERRKRARKYSV